MTIATDTTRWEKLANQEERPSWQSRNNVIAEYIPTGVSVLDIGCGNQDMKHLIGTSCSYTGLDCVKHNLSDVIVLDFNAVDASDVVLNKRYDYAICSGVLEYINDPLAFIKFVSANAENIILSYILAETRLTIRECAADGWISNLNRVQLQKLLTDNGLKTTHETKYRSHSIFVLSH
jgi:hypothetical protein